jgi:hypothetical protein
MELQEEEARTQLQTNENFQKKGRRPPSPAKPSSSPAI